MHIHVSLQVTGLSAGVVAFLAQKWLCVTVYQNVCLQLIYSATCVTTNLTSKWSLATVYKHVSFLLTCPNERTFTFFTGVSFKIRLFTSVLSEHVVS